MDLGKYKRRIVFAVRDFPPGCGIFAPPLTHKPPNQDVDNSVDALNVTQVKCGSPSPGMEGVITPVVFNENGNGMEFAAVKSDPQTGSGSVESNVRLEICVDEKVVRPVKASELEHTGLVSKVSDSSLIKGVVQSKYPPPRKVSAVRDFPPFCGRNAALVKQEREDVQGREVVPHSEMGVSRQGKSCIEECSLKDMVKNDGKQMGVNVPGKDSQSCGFKRKLCALSDDSVHAEDESLADEEIDNTDEVELFYQKQIELAQEDVEEEAGIDSFESSHRKNLALKPENARVDVRGSLTSTQSLNRGNVDCRPNKPGSSKSGPQQHKAAINKNRNEEQFKGTEMSAKKNSFHIKKPFQSENQAIRKNKVKVDHGKDYANNCADGEAGGNKVSDARRKVKQALDLYRSVYNELQRESNCRRTDLEAAKMLKARGQYVNVGKQISGPVPGVEVGDRFHYWVELNIVGLHRQSQGGIDYVKEGQRIRATSIVASGSYDDDTGDSDVLIYTGAGGNVIGKKEPEDQKLERGNLSLKNSMDSKKPVRVIRGFSSADARKTYFYDGLYTVESYWQEKGSHGKLIYKFKLVRDPDQPVLKKSKKL